MPLQLGWAVAVAAVGAFYSLLAGRSRSSTSGPHALAAPAAATRPPPAGCLPSRFQATSTMRPAPASGWSLSCRPASLARTWRCARFRTPSATTWPSRSPLGRWCSACTGHQGWASPCSICWRPMRCTTASRSGRACAAQDWTVRATRWAGLGAVAASERGGHSGMARNATERSGQRLGWQWACCGCPPTACYHREAAVGGLQQMPSGRRMPCSAPPNACCSQCDQAPVRLTSLQVLYGMDYTADERAAQHGALRAALLDHVRHAPESRKCTGVLFLGSVFVLTFCCRVCWWVEGCLTFMGVDFIQFPIACRHANAHVSSCSAGGGGL